MRRRLVLVLVIVLLLLVAACGDDDGGTVTQPSSTTESTATTSASGGSSTSTTVAEDEQGDQPIATPGTGTTEGQGDRGLLKAVRLASHDGFDRIVFEFEDAVPGYKVEYVDPPITEDASGKTVDVDGDAFLQIRMEPASGFDTTGEGRQTYTGPDRIAGRGTPIEELVRTGDFEAVLTWVAGVSGGEQPFAVGTLDGPPRLVVDVTTD